MAIPERDYMLPARIFLGLNQKVRRRYLHQSNKTGFGKYPDAVLVAVCKKYDVSYDGLQARNRARALRHPRQVFMYILRVHCHLTYEEIGYITLRNHATCINGRKKIAGYIEMGDKNLEKEVNEIIIEAKKIRDDQ